MTPFPQANGANRANGASSWSLDFVRGHRANDRFARKGTLSSRRWSPGIPQRRIGHSKGPRKPQREATRHPGPRRVWISGLVGHLVAPFPRANEANRANRSNSRSLGSVRRHRANDRFARRKGERKTGRESGKGSYINKLPINRKAAIYL